MTDELVIERETITNTRTDPRETIEKEGVVGAPPHIDEEAGGAVVGGAAGIVVGALVGGPIGAVVGGAIGAAVGATAGVIDESGSSGVVVTPEEQPMEERPL